MSNKPITVTDISQLIAANAEARAKLQVLAVEAYEHWRDIEARILELEGRLAIACGASSEVRLRAAARVELEVEGELAANAHFP